MSDSQNTSTISHWQKIFAIFGGIIAPLFVVYALTKSPDAPQSAAADVEKRIKPLAVVEVSKETGPHVDKSGEEVVKTACAACHAAGAMGAPKLGDKGDWKTRIAQGYQTLIKHATEGIRTMPARGGNPDLSDNEIAGAVAFMANQAGAKFVVPKSVESKPAESKPDDAK